MKIKTELLGSTFYSKTLGQNIEVKEGNEALLKSIGADVFIKVTPAEKAEKEKKAEVKNDSNK